MPVNHPSRVHALINYILFSSRLKIQIIPKSKNYSSVYSVLIQSLETGMDSLSSHLLSPLCGNWWIPGLASRQSPFLLRQYPFGFGRNTLPSFLANVLCIQLVPSQAPLSDHSDWLRNGHVAWSEPMKSNKMFIGDSKKEDSLLRGQVVCEGC